MAPESNNTKAHSLWGCKEPRTQAGATSESLRLGHHRSIFSWASFIMSDAGCSSSCQHDSTKDSRSVIILTAMSWLKMFWTCAADKWQIAVAPLSSMFLCRRIAFLLKLSGAQVDGMSIQQSTIEQPQVLRKKFCLMLHWFRSIPEVEIFNFNQNSLIRCFQSPDNFDTGTTDDLSASGTRRVVCWHGWKNTAIFLQHQFSKQPTDWRCFQSKRSRIHNGSPWFSFMSGQRIRSRIHIFKLNWTGFHLRAELGRWNPWKTRWMKGENLNKIHRSN